MYYKEKFEADYSYSVGFKRLIANKESIQIGGQYSLLLLEKKKNFGHWHILGLSYIHSCMSCTMYLKRFFERAEKKRKLRKNVYISFVIQRPELGK